MGLAADGPGRKLTPRLWVRYYVIGRKELLARLGDSSLVRHLTGLPENSVYRFIIIYLR